MLHFRCRFLIVSIALAGLGLSGPAGAGLPQLTASVPTDAFVGEEFCFSTSFTNGDPGELGFGPYYRLIVGDDFTINSASFLGASLSPQLVGSFGAPPPPGNELTDPISGDPVTGTQNSKFYVVRYPIGSVTSTSPPLDLDVCVSVAADAVINVAQNDAVSITPGFEFGDTATGANGAQVGAASSFPVTPRVITYSISDMTAEDERPPGPLWQWNVQACANIASDRVVTPIDFNTVEPINLPNNIQFVGPIAFSGTGVNCAATTLPADLTAGPGGSIDLNCTSGNGIIGNGEEICATFPVYITDTLDPLSCDTDTSINTAKHVALQKGSGGGATPGAVRNYSVNIQVSEYVAGITRLEIIDTLPDGVTFNDDAQVNFGSGAVLLTGALRTVDPGTPGPGQTQVTYFITNAVGPLGPAASGTLTYSATIDQTYEAPPLNNQPIRSRDVLSNTLTSSYDISAGATDCSDTSGDSFTIEDISIGKTLIDPAGGIVEPGDSVTFRLRMDIPSGDVQGIVFEDFFPFPVFNAASLSTVTDLNVNPDIDYGPNHDAPRVPVSINTNAGDNRLEILWPDVVTTSPQVIEVDVTIEVTNDPFADGLALSNIFRAMTDNTPADDDTDLTIVQITARSPQLSIAKTVVGASSDLTPGDTVTYDLIASNASTAEAYDVIVTDDAPAGLTNCALASATGGAGAPGDSPFDVDGFRFTSFDLPTNTALDGGASVTLQVTCDVDISATPGQSITNTATVTWASAPGATAFPAQTIDATVTTENIATPVKAVLATSEVSTPDSSPRPLAPGEVARFRMSVAIPEGTLNNASLTDFIPPGLQFVNDGTLRIAFVGNDTGGITASSLGQANCASGTLEQAGSLASITPDCALAPQAGPFSSGTDVALSLGDVVNDELDGDEEYILLELNAVALDDQANGTTNGNQFRILSDEVDVQSPQAQVRHAKPELQITKDAVPNVLDAGDLVTYTITIEHTGSSLADAFDISFGDQLDGTQLTNFTFISGPVAPGGETCTATGAVVDATDPFVAGISISFDSLPLGEVCEISYSAETQASVLPGQAVPNTATVDYDSLPGNGTDPNVTGSPPGAAGSYNVQDTGDVTIQAPVLELAIDSTSLTHTPDGGAGTAAGDPRLLSVDEVIRYRIEVRLPEGSAPDFTINSLLPPGLRYETGTARLAFLAEGAGIVAAPAIICLNGGTLNATGDETNLASTEPDCEIAASGGPFASGTDPVFNLGDLMNDDMDADQEYVILEFDARVVNEIGVQQGTDLDSLYQLSINGSNAGSSTTAFAEVVEPQLSCAVNVTPDPIDNLVEPTPTAAFSYTLTNTGGASAFQAGAPAGGGWIIDLPTGLENIVNLTVTPTGDLFLNGTSTPVGAGDFTLSGADSNVLTAVAPLQFAPGSSLVVAFEANLQATVLPGDSLDDNCAIVYAAQAAGNAGDNVRDGSDLASGAGNSPINDATNLNDYRTETPSTLNTIAEEPEIGVANQVVAGPLSNGDGSYDLSFEIRVENTGNVGLENLTLIDDLAGTFSGAGIALNSVNVVSDSGTLVLNPAYTGAGANTNLLDPTSTLPVGEAGTVTVSITVTPGANLGPFNNSVTGTAESDRSAAPVSDLSDDGAVVDEDGDGDPTDESDPTVVTFPVLGVAKDATVGTPNFDGTFTSTITIAVENFGAVTVSDVQVVDELAATLAPATIVSIDNLAAAGALSLTNAGFDGNGNTNLLTGSESLVSGGTATISFDMTFDPSCSVGPFSNVATASGMRPGGLPVEDDSVAGTDPDANGNGDPTDDASPTPISITVGTDGLVELTEQILPGETLTLTVTDAEQNLDSGGVDTVDATITNVTTGETEDLVLVETDPNSGVFTADLPTIEAAGAGTNNDGVLTVAYVQDLQASYTDTLTSTGCVVELTDTGVVVGLATVSGNVWLEQNPDDVFDPAEQALEAWIVELRDMNGVLVATVPVAADGSYTIPDVLPGMDYTISVLHPATGASFGLIEDLDLLPDQTVVDLNLPIDPSGVFYDVAQRTALSGTTVRITDNAGTPLPNACVLPGQQNQVTAADGFYRIDLLPDADPACASGGTFCLAFDVPGGYQDGFSQLLQPLPNPLDPTGLADPVQVGSSAAPPQIGDPTDYYSCFTLESSDPDIVFNNVPLDPVGLELDSVRLTKTADRSQISVGGLIRYTITIENLSTVPLPNIEVTDSLPPGFVYAENSARLDGDATGFTVTGPRPLIFSSIALAGEQRRELRYILRVGAGVTQGEYINTATPNLSGIPIGNSDTASVQVVADPDFEETTIIGKVWNDRDGDGWQDSADATGLTLSGGPFGDARQLEDLSGRSSQYADPENHSLTLIVASSDEPLVLTSAEGSQVTLLPDGRLLNEHRGQVADGQNSQVLTISRKQLMKAPREIKRPLTQTSTVTLDQVVEAVRFPSGKARIPTEAVANLRDALAELQGKKNLRVRFVGHTDDEPLTPRTAAVYRDNQGLSEARARTVAEFMQSALGLPASALEWDGRGDSEPVAWNDTPANMAKNRRVEIFVLYDETEILETTETIIEAPEPLGEMAVTVTNLGLSEPGIPGVRVATVEGLVIETDSFGRYHIAAVDGGFLERGRNYIVKVDPSTLPDTAEFTTENPRVKRITQGLLNQFDFGMRLANQAAIAPAEALRRQTTDGVGTIQSATNAAPPAMTAANDCRGENCITTDGQQLRILGGNPGPGRATSAAAYQEQTEGFARGGRVWMTEDPDVLEPRLAVSGPAQLPVANRRVSSRTRFIAYTNYAAFIDSAELHLYRETDADRIEPVAVISFDGTVDPFTSFLYFEWDGATGSRLDAGERLAYVLRVRDKEGRLDETAESFIQLMDNASFQRAEQEQETRWLQQAEAQPQWPISLNGTTGVVNPELAHWTLARIYGRSQIVRQQIPLHGSRVRLSGGDFGDKASLYVNEHWLPIDVNDRFAVEYILPIGQHVANVSGRYLSGEQWQREIPVEVTGKHLFLVALADMTLSDNSIDGSLEPLSGDDRYDDDILAEGRIAFYLKGKIKGRYLITGQLDSQEEELDNLLSNLGDRNTDSLFRRIDPDRYYPVYGDDSTTVADTNSLGRFYVRVDWDRSQAVWGNYQTKLTDSEFIQYNRSLYGAQASIKSVNTTALDETRGEATLFVAENETALGHVEFLGTGGSLYYLRHLDILAGSDQVRIEIRDRDSGRVMDVIPLARGVDYQIDELQGRVILNRPLLTIAQQAAPSVIKDGPLDGNLAVMIVDYEYVPDSFDENNVIAGGRVKRWLGDHLRVGGAYIHESRDSEDYGLAGADLVLQAGKGTYFKAEAASSDATQTERLFSTDGGLTFQSLSASSAQDRSGSAYGFEARMNTKELGWTEGQTTAAAWWRHTDADFSVARRDTGVDVEEVGAELITEVNDRITLSGRAARVDRKEQLEDTSVSAQVDYRLNEDGTLSGEVRYIEQIGPGDLAIDATLVGVQYAHRFSDALEAYLSGQLAIDSSDQYEDNGLVTVGAVYGLNDRMSLTTETSSGERGNATTVGLEYQVNSDHTVYGSVTHSADRSDSPWQGVADQSRQGLLPGSSLSLGHRSALSDQVKIFNESQISNASSALSLGHVFGLDWASPSGYNLNFSLQRSDADSRLGVVKRDAVSLGGGYRGQRLNWSSRLEFRKDRGDTRVEQWVTTNRLGWKLSQNYRLLGKLNWADTNDDADIRDNTQLIEASFGIAYRPVDTNKLNWLAKYTYLYDLQSAGQLDAGTDQSSHVVSVEGIRSFGKRWSLGGKLAWRESRLRIDRNTGDWFDEVATFGAARVRYHFTSKWDGLAEYRLLTLDESSSNRQGWLVGVDRHLGDNFKVGVGYNFTEFSDDLTNLDYDLEGWFLNILGKY
jgi:uncharacterized repeat protein (TIGR01451 family)